MVIYVKEINNFDKLLKEKGLNIFDFFENFRVKTDKIYIVDILKRKVRQNKEFIFKDISIKDLKDNDKIEFDILGFLYNIKKGDFYIRNIEILEKIFSRDYKSKKAIDYLDHLEYFFEKYKEEIDLNLKDKNMIKLYNKKFNVSKIEDFITKIGEDNELKDEFNYLMYPKNLREINERKDSKDIFKKKFKKIFHEILTGNKNFEYELNLITFEEILNEKIKYFLDNNKIFKIRFKNTLNIFNKNIKKEVETLGKKQKSDGKEIKNIEEKYIKKIIDIFENSFENKGTEE